MTVLLEYILMTALFPHKRKGGLHWHETSIKGRTPGQRGAEHTESLSVNILSLN